MTTGPRILVIGAGGFIGRHVFATLLTNGFAPVALVRRAPTVRRMFPEAEVISCDLTRATAAADWIPHLKGVSAVVNCAGVLTDRHSRAVHVDAPRALHDACIAAGVRRVILISAISATGDAGTLYADEKRAGEEDLKSRDLDWVILRPSLVYADGSYGGTSVLRGLAGLPGMIPLPGKGEQVFSPIHAEDLAQSILRLLASRASSRLVLDPCGPDILTLREIVSSWRNWLGLKPAPILSVPMPLVRLMAKLADMAGGGPLSSTAVRQLEIGNAGDGAAFAAAIGFQPASMRDWLARRPSSVQDKWHSRLFFLRPALRGVLGFSWLISGLVGLTAGLPMAVALLAPFDLVALAKPITWITSLLDLGIGLAILSRKAPGLLLVAQGLVVIGYSLALTVLAPALWADPFGVLVKNFAFLGLAATVAALEDDR